MIVGLLLKHFVLVALVVSGSLFVRRKPAAVQHRYWLLGFVWIAALPLLAVLVPSYRIETTKPDYSRHFSLPAFATPATQAASALAKPTRAETAPTAPRRSGPAQTGISSPGFASSPQGQFAAGTALFGVCLLGVLIGLLRFASSLIKLRRLVQPEGEPSGETRFALFAATAKTGLRSKPSLVVNPQAPAPFTCWLGRHIIVIPSDESSEAVLVHECAHIRRGDWFAQVFCGLVCTAYWFDPAIWWMGRRMRSLSETAADDFVVGAGIEPARYAEELVSISALFAGKRLEGGLAIVGNGDLKHRIGQLLRSGPRITRVKSRWMAGAVCAGAAVAVACASVLYAQRTLPAADHGLAVLPDGGWVHLMAITEESNGHAVSWNMDGELLPRPIFPNSGDIMNPDPAKNGQYLVFESDIEEHDGFAVYPLGAPMDLAHNLADPMWSPGGESMSGNQLWVTRVDLARTPTVGVVASIPVDEPWRVLAEANYEKDRMVSATQQGLFPAQLVAGQETAILAPPGVTGRVELLTYTAGEPRPMSQIMDASALPRFSYMVPSASIPIGRVTRFVLRSRPGTVSNVLFDGIPTAPRSRSIEAALPPAGVSFQTATNGRYLFLTGEELSLVSTAKVDGPHVSVFSPRIGEAMTDPGAARTAVQLTREWSSPSAPLSDMRQGESRRFFHFLIRTHTGQRLFASEAVSLFDAAGSRVGAGSSMATMVYGTDTYIGFGEPSDAGPQDFVVRIADPTRGARRRMSLHEAYSDWSTKPTKSDWAGNEIRTVDWSATRQAALAGSFDTTREDVAWYLVDAHGRRVTALTYQSDGAHDTYTIPESAGTKFVAVEIVTKPYVFVRFPQVWVNPK